MKLLPDVKKNESEKKKKQTYESLNPFQLLLPLETWVEPIPVISYEICYGRPAVTTQTAARTIDEAILLC